MQQNNDIGGDKVPPGDSSPKLKNTSKIQQNSLSPKAQRKTNKHPTSLNVKKPSENHTKDPNTSSPTTQLKKISIRRIAQANEKQKPVLEEPQMNRRKLLLPKFNEKIKLSIETNSPTQASPKLHSIKFPNTTRPSLSSREAFQRSPGLSTKSNSTQDPKYFVSPRLSLVKNEVKSESPRKSSILLPKISVPEVNSSTDSKFAENSSSNNQQQRLQPAFNFMRMTVASSQNRRNSQVIGAKPTMHFGSMRSQGPSFLIPGSVNLHKESPETVTKSRRGSVNLLHSKDGDEIHKDLIDDHGKMLHPLRKSSNFSIKKDEELPKTDSPNIDINVSQASSQTESSDDEEESVDSQECETPTKLPIKIPLSFNSARKSRFALIATKSVPAFMTPKSSSDDKLFKRDQEIQEKDSESSPRNNDKPRETLADLEDAQSKDSSSSFFQADEGRRNTIHLENLNEDYGLPAVNLLTSLTSRAASSLPNNEVPEKVVKSQSLSPRKHNNKAASDFYQFDDIERRKSSETEKEKYKIFKDNNVNFFEFNENNLLFGRENNIFAMDKIFRSSIKSKTYAEMQVDSSARVVSYGDEHRSIAIHPKYMELYGSMCFTELWSGKKKRNFTHQKSEESDPIRKKGNADPIMRPKKSKETNIVLARLEANKQGNQSSATRIHEFFGLATKAESKKSRPIKEMQGKIYPKLKGVYNIEDSPVQKPIQISINRRISLYHNE